MLDEEGMTEGFRSRGVMAEPGFRRLWMNAVVNGFGRQVSNLALPLCALSMLGATGEQMGFLSAAQVLPFVIFALPGGALLDRFPLRPVLLGFELVYAVVILGIPVAYACGLLSLPWLYVTVFILGVGFAIGGSAEQMVLTRVVGRERLIEAQARLAGVESVTRLLGPSLAGFLLQYMIAPLVMLVEGMGFVVSFFSLRHLEFKDANNPQVKLPLWHDMLDGLRFVWAHPVLRQLAMMAGIWNLLFFGNGAIQLLFGLRELGFNERELGLIQTCGGLGVLCSAWLMPRLERKCRVSGVLLIGLILTGVGIVMEALAPSIRAVGSWYAMLYFGLTQVVLDCGGVLFIMPYIALRQRVTPDAYLGRMTSTMRFVTVSIAPIGAIVAGELAQHIGARQAIVALAAGVLLLCVVSSVKYRSLSAAVR